LQRYAEEDAAEVAEVLDFAAKSLRLGPGVGLYTLNPVDPVDP
jgi:hypothetical protein